MAEDKTPKKVVDDGRLVWGSEEFIDAILDDMRASAQLFEFDMEGDFGYLKRNQPEVAKQIEQGKINIANHIDFIEVTRETLDRTDLPPGLDKFSAQDEILMFVEAAQYEQRTQGTGKINGLTIPELGVTDVQAQDPEFKKIFTNQFTDTPTNVAGAEVIDEGVDITESSAGVVDEIEGIQQETVEKLRIANDAFVDQQLDDIMARKINEVLPFVDTSISRADAIGIAITGPQVLDSADPVLNSFIKEIEQLTGQSLQTSEKRKLREFIYDMARGKDNLLDDKKSFISNLRDGLDNSKLKDPGYKIWKNWQNSGAFIPENLLGRTVNEFSAFGPPSYVLLLEGLEKSGETINYTAISDTGLEVPDKPTNVVGNEFVDNYGKTTTGFIDDLPLKKPVKDLFLNAADSRLKKLGTQVATPGGILDAVDIWEMGVLTLVAGAIAYNEIDEIPKITKNTILRTYNLSQGRPIDAPLRIIGLPVLSVSEYDIDFKYAMETLEKGEKVMPTEIAIKKVGEIAKGVGEQGLATGFGYVPTTPKNTDTMETTQKIQPGVQEEKMFEKLRPKKTKSAGGSGAKIL